MKIENLYEILDKEAQTIAENSKSCIYLTEPAVLTLVKLKNGSYYCLETKKICQVYTLKKGYADDVLFEIFDNKEKQNEKEKNIHNQI